MVYKLGIDEFLQQSENHPVLDVRSPAEFQHAHIPGAFSLPLFSNEERVIIGTLYKQQGREVAMMKGLEFYGINMQRIIHDLKNFTNDRQVFLHCWRGGMRSGLVAWMLDLFGYRVFTLNGGYKNFRRTVLDSFSTFKNILILGGKTGSAKTKVLEELDLQDEQVINLEKLAHHKGSAFGGIDEPTPPSQEQFENDLFWQLKKLDTSKPAWVEDESQRIGNINLPNAIWKQMRDAPVMYLEIPFVERLNYLTETYGHFELEQLKAATLRIQKRLGSLETKNTIKFLDEGKTKEAFSILLKYYDKFYSRATESRSQRLISKITLNKIDPKNAASEIMSYNKSQLVSR